VGAACSSLDWVGSTAPAGMAEAAMKTDVSPARRLSGRLHLRADQSGPRGRREQSTGPVSRCSPGRPTGTTSWRPTTISIRFVHAARVPPTR